MQRSSARRWWTAAVAQAALAAPVGAQPAPYPGHLVDAASGVVFRRCDLGTVMDSQTGVCVGKAARLNWVDAIVLVQELNAGRFEGFDDWRLMTSDDLRLLLLQVPQIRDVKQPVTRGNATAFGGYQLKVDMALCAAANGKVREVFGAVNQVGGDFIESHRWMADNTDRKAWQKPLSLNLVPSYGMHSVGHCNVLVYAFLEDQFDSKREGQVRPHGDQPMLITRGGDPGKAWDQARSAVAQRAVILGESEAQGRAAVARVASTLAAIRNTMADVLAAGSRAQAADASAGTGQRELPTPVAEEQGGVRSITEFGKLNQPRNPVGYQVVCNSGRREMLFRSPFSDAGDWYFTYPVVNTFVAKGGSSLREAAAALCRR